MRPAHRDTSAVPGLPSCCEVLLSLGSIAGYFQRSSRRRRIRLAILLLEHLLKFEPFCAPPRNETSHSGTESSVPPAGGTPSFQDAPPPTSDASPPDRLATTEGIEEYEPLTPELVEEEAIRGRPRNPVVGCVAGLSAGSTRIAETAVPGARQTGQYLAKNGIIPPAHDIFSYTAGDRPWTNLAWGFDLLAAGIHDLGSFAGLSAFKALLVAIAFWLMSLVSRPGIPILVGVDLWTGGAPRRSSADCRRSDPRDLRRPGPRPGADASMARIGGDRYGKRLEAVVAICPLDGGLEQSGRLGLAGLVYLLLFAAGGQSGGVAEVADSASRTGPPGVVEGGGRFGSRNAAASVRMEIAGRPLVRL